MLDGIRKKLQTMYLEWNFIYRRTWRRMTASFNRIVLLIDILRYRILKQYTLWLAPDEESRQQLLLRYRDSELMLYERLRRTREQSMHIMRLLTNYIEGTKEMVDAVGCKYGLNGVITEVPAEKLARAPEDFAFAKSKMLLNLRWLYQLCPDNTTEGSLSKLEELQFEDFDTTPEAQNEIIGMLFRLPTNGLDEIVLTIK